VLDEESRVVRHSNGVAGLISKQYRDLRVELIVYISELAVKMVGRTQYEARF
jgi:hypothetical protein